MSGALYLGGVMTGFQKDSRSCAFVVVVVFFIKANQNFFFSD